MSSVKRTLFAIYLTRVILPPCIVSHLLPGCYLIIDALYAESGQNASYPRPVTVPPGENKIIMFQSNFSNSQLNGNPDDPPTVGPNPLRGQGAGSDYLTVANAKGVYNDLLSYFATRQDKLFVVITAPPRRGSETSLSLAANARALNRWLTESWLTDYPYSNVGVFDYYNVLTSNGGDVYTNDLGWATGNHHRYRAGAIDYVTDQWSNFNAYPEGDSYPTQAGLFKATGEFPPLLNIFYHRWLDGMVNKSVLPTSSWYGEAVAYTIVLQGLTPTATVSLTDVVPVGLSYLTGTLTSTVGTVDDSAAPALYWSGNLGASPTITISYGVAVTATQNATITNTALFTIAGEAFSRSASLRVYPPFRFHLPMVWRSE